MYKYLVLISIISVIFSINKLINYLMSNYYINLI